MKRRIGFTLIELLVVIAIIAILAAILFPIMTAAKARATSTKCLNNLKQLSTAIQQYCDDNSGVMPCILGTASSQRLDWAGVVSYTGQLNNVRNGQLWPYVRNMKVYMCPLDHRKNTQLSYSINRDMGCIYGAPESDPRRLLKLETESLGRATKIMLFIQEKACNDGYCEWSTIDDIPSDVHYSGTNLAYVDGHVKYATQKEMLAEINKGWWLNNTHYYASAHPSD